MAYIGKSPTGSGVRTRYYYTATGGETSLSGADDNGKTLTFSDGEYMDVYLNGVLLVHGTDYGTGTANTISSLAALAGGDIAEVIVYDVYNIADVNRKALRTRYYKTASGGETSISGTDDSGATITFAANAQIEVKLNGVSLVQGTDYNTTTANTVGGLAALTAGQVVEIVKYERFVLGDTVSKADGGTFVGDVGVPNLTASGNAIVTGDLTVDTNTLYVDSTNNNVGIGTSSPINNSTTNLQIHGGVASGSSELRLTNADTGATASDGFQLQMYQGTEAYLNNRENGPMIFKTNNSEAMRINSSGDVIIGTGEFSLGTSSYSGAKLATLNRSNDGELMRFENGGASKGTITVNSSSTAYNTSSDYRLKENVTADWDATTRLKQLNPVRFNFIADPDTTVDGFLAHEVQDIVPEAISGTKDGVDVEGNPEYQGIDQSKLVPLLVKTIQELEARIAALENA